MSAISGKVGAWELELKSVPRGAEGTVEVTAGKKSFTVRWRRDEYGIWIETPDEIAGYDIEGERNDEGAIRYRLLRRSAAGEYAGLSFKRAGEIETTSSSAARKSIRVRSQMPGKIVRVQVKAGDTVSKGDALLVMEAMKMENEIRATYAGTVKTVHVSPGQAVETGADLVLMEGA